MDATVRTKLHQFIDILPDNEIPAIERFIEFIIEKVNNPILLALALAPTDNEPLSKEEKKAVREARDEILTGKFSTLDDIKKEFRIK